MFEGSFEATGLEVCLLGKAFRLWLEAVSVTGLRQAARLEESFCLLPSVTGF